MTTTQNSKMRGVMILIALVIVLIILFVGYTLTTQVLASVGILTILYILVNVIPLPFWFLMIFFPHRRFTKAIMSNYMVFLVLGALYIFCLVGAIAAGISASTQGGPALNFSTPQGLGAMLASPATALVIWLHLVTMDLIGGHWLYHEAQRVHAPTLFTAISLLMTFIVGPLGLFIFVLWRSLVHMRVAAVVHDVDKTDSLTAVRA